MQPRLAMAGIQHKKNLPLFFSNTYDINSGFKGLIAPVTLNKEDFPGSDFTDRILSIKRRTYT